MDKPSLDTRLDSAWLDAHWMPFTGNRELKAHPRMFVAAEGAYYTDADGQKAFDAYSAESEGKRLFDGLSGLWCCGLGHARREIAEAIAQTARTLDYAPA